MADDAFDEESPPFGTAGEWSDGALTPANLVTVAASRSFDWARSIAAEHGDRDGVRHQLLLLARMSDSGQDEASVAALEPGDFVAPELAAAFRLLSTYGWSVDTARAAAVDLEVAAALDSVGRLNDLHAGGGWSSPDLEPSVRLLLQHRLLVAQAERRFELARRLADDTDVEAAWRTATEEIDAAHQRIKGLLDGTGGLAIDAAPMLPTPTKLVGAGTYPVLLGRPRAPRTPTCAAAGPRGHEEDRSQ